MSPLRDYYTGRSELEDLKRRLALEEADIAASKGNVKGVNQALNSLDLTTTRLMGERDRLIAKAEKMGGEHRKGGPSILSRAFDFLSRGQYATANAFDAALSGDTGAILSDFGRGLWGTKKNNFANVFEKHPEALGIVGQKFLDNPKGRAVAGFAGDVILDPTTYTGAGLVKGVTKEVADASASKLAGQALQQAHKSGDLTRVAKEAKTSLRTERLLSKAKVPSKKELNRAAKEAVRQTEERIANLATRGALEETPDKIQLRLMGMDIAESERAARILKAPAKKLGQTDIGKSLSTLFRTKSATGPLDQKRRMFVGRSVSEFEDYSKKPILNLNGKDYSWMTLGDVVTKDEMKSFIKAYEKGQVSELLPSKSGIDWEDLADVVRRENKNIYAHDVGEGLIDPTKTPELENYIYHHYQVPESKAVGFKQKRNKAIASDSYKPALERKIPTLDEVPENLKPSYDLRQIMLKRAAKSYSSTARKNYIQDAIESMGMKLEKDALKGMKAQGHDLVNVKNYLSSSLKKGDKDKLLNFLDGDEYLPRQVAEHLGAVERVFNAPEEVEGLLKLYDNVLTKWKAAATIYNPGHHLRNLSTDIFLNFVDGVKDPRVYNQAMDILFRGTEGSIKINGQRVAKLDILRAFKETGAAPGWITTNVDEGLPIFRGKITRSLREVSGKREELGRLAHWIDAVGKEAKGKSLRNLDNLHEAGRKAAERVRHWNIDYTDLTPFERTVMKRIMPFYTWMRHSTPLMIEAMVTRPGKVAVVPKGVSALQQLLGVDPESALPLNLTPKWLREMGGFQIGERGGNPLFMNPFFFPGVETANMFEGGPQAIIGNLASQTSPLIRAPFELGTGRTLFGQIPIQDTKQYLLNQIPAARVANTTLSNRSDPERNDITTRLLTYLTGTGQYEVTPNRIRGEIRRQMDPLEQYVRKARNSGN